MYNLQNNTHYTRVSLTTFPEDSDIYRDTEEMQSHKSHAAKRTRNHELPETARPARAAAFATCAACTNCICIGVLGIWNGHWRLRQATPTAERLRAGPTAARRQLTDFPPPRRWGRQLCSRRAESHRRCGSCTPTGCSSPCRRPARSVHTGPRRREPSARLQLSSKQ